MEGEAAIEGEASEPIPPPKNSRIRIENKGSETCFHFPNTVETRSYSGIGSVLIGFVLFSFPTWLIGRTAWRHWGNLSETVPSWPEAIPGLLFGGLFALIGLAALLNGLTRLFGKRTLSISPERIAYRNRVFGISLPWSLPTGDVLTVGLTKNRRGRSARGAASKGYVIRTAKREINYSEAARDAIRNQTEAEWLVGEIARRIQLARLRR